MVAPGERRDCERLGMIPPLGACGQHERPPMRGNGRVKKRNGESRNRVVKTASFTLRENAGRA